MVKYKNKQIDSKNKKTEFESHIYSFVVFWFFFLELGQTETIIRVYILSILHLKLFSLLIGYLHRWLLLKFVKKIKIIKFSKSKFYYL